MKPIGNTSFPDVRDVAFIDFHWNHTSWFKILKPLLVTNLDPSTLKGFLTNCLSQALAWGKGSQMMDFKGKQRSFYIKHCTLAGYGVLLLWICLILTAFILTDVISTGIWVLSFPVMVSAVAPQTALHSWHIWWHASAQRGTKALVLDTSLQTVAWSKLSASFWTLKQKWQIIL